MEEEVGHIRVHRQNTSSNVQHSVDVWVCMWRGSVFHKEGVDKEMATYTVRHVDSYLSPCGCATGVVCREMQQVWIVGVVRMEYTTSSNLKCQIRVCITIESLTIRTRVKSLTGYAVLESGFLILPHPKSPVSTTCNMISMASSHVYRITYPMRLSRQI